MSMRLHLGMLGSGRLLSPGPVEGPLKKTGR